MFKNLIIATMIIVLFGSNEAQGNSRITHSQLKKLNRSINLSIAYKEAAAAAGVDVKLLRAVCFVESSHRANIVRTLDFNAPSYGICQLQMRTAREMGFRGTSVDLLYAPINMYFAAKYLAHWLRLTKGDWRKAVSAYNRGHLSKRLAYSYTNRVRFAIRENR